MPANCMPGNLGGFDVMYERKTWKNRETEFPGRRRMTAVDGQEDVFDVSREEGLILEEGDAFDADTMNNMEQRVGEGFSNTCQYLYKATFLLDGWTGEGPYTQTVAVTPDENDAPAITAASSMQSPVMIDDGFTGDTYNQMNEAGAIVNAGTKTLGDGTITCVTKGTIKPACDVEVFFLAKMGGDE